MFVRVVEGTTASRRSMDIDGFILMQREAKILSPHLTTTFLFFSSKQKRVEASEADNHPRGSSRQYSPTGSKHSSGNASCTCVMNICVADIGAYTYTIHMTRGDRCVHCTFISCHPDVSMGYPSTDLI